MVVRGRGPDGRPRAASAGTSTAATVGRSSVLGPASSPSGGVSAASMNRQDVQDLPARGIGQSLEHVG